MSDERDELWKEYAESPTPELREKIILANMKLVYQIVNRMRRFGFWTYISKDDLQSAGTRALIQCVDSFKPTKNTYFAGYAYPAIKTAVAREVAFIRGQKYDRESKSYYPIKSPETTDGLTGKRIACHRDKRTRQDRLDVFREACRGLSIKDRLLLIDYFYEDKTIADIAAEHGLTKQRIHQKLHKILNRIRKHWTVDPEAAGSSPVILAAVGNTEIPRKNRHF